MISNVCCRHDWVILLAINLLVNRKRFQSCGWTLAWLEMGACCGWNSLSQPVSCQLGLLNLAENWPEISWQLNGSFQLSVFSQRCWNPSKIMLQGWVGGYIYLYFIKTATLLDVCVAKKTKTSSNLQYCYLLLKTNQIQSSKAKLVKF